MTAFASSMAKPRTHASATATKKKSLPAALAKRAGATSADETVAHAIREGVVVGKRRIDVKRESVRGIAEATREIPRARGTRGRHLSDGDAALAKKLARAIHQLRLDAKLTAKAGLAGKGGRLVIDVALAGCPCPRPCARRAELSLGPRTFFDVEEPT